MDENPSLVKVEPTSKLSLKSSHAASVEAVVVEGLACQRGGRTVVSGISFKVEAGSALALRGPNGSGKTTLLRTIAGYLQPAAGEIHVVRGLRPPHPSPLPQARLGELGTLSDRIRKRMRWGRGSQAAGLSFEGEANSGVPSPLGEKDRMRGDSAEGAYHYIGHANGIKPRLSVIENVSFWQRYYSGGEDIEAAEDALEAFALLNLASFSAGHLSQGQARRLGLARLMAARRPVWLLDEPQAALDTASTRLLERAIAAHLSSGGLAIVSTHLDLALPDAQVLELGMPVFVE